MTTIKNPKLKGKGVPPGIEQTKNNLSHPASDGNAPIEKTVPIQFKITENEYNQFCQLAGTEIGYKKGDKSKMFSKMLKRHAKLLA